jgi:hypothetical protein
MDNWAICFDINLPFLFREVINYKLVSHDIVEISHEDNVYNTSIENIRIITPLKYVIGDQVSPKNHPEIIGIIWNIIFHFDKNEPMYYIKINGKKKSKRYFENDLICRN